MGLPMRNGDALQRSSYPCSTTSSVSGGSVLLEVLDCAFSKMVSSTLVLMTSMLFWLFSTSIARSDKLFWRGVLSFVACF